MSKEIKNSSIYLSEMINACDKVTTYVSQTNKDEFMLKTQPFDAICMQLAHMGEQVSLIEKHSDRLILKFPDEVDWPAIKALRNRIGHAYASVDAELIWEFAQNQIIDLRSSVARILSKRFGITT